MQITVWRVNWIRRVIYAFPVMRDGCLTNVNTSIRTVRPSIFITYYKKALQSLNSRFFTKHWLLRKEKPLRRIFGIGIFCLNVCLCEIVNCGSYLFEGFVPSFVNMQQWMQKSWSWCVHMRLQAQFTLAQLLAHLQVFFTSVAFDTIWKPKK